MPMSTLTESVVEHRILIVPDYSIPVDVLVGSTWLVLLLIHYHKKNNEIVLRSINNIDTDSLSEDSRYEHVKLNSAEVKIINKTLITMGEVRIDPQVSVENCNCLMLLTYNFRDILVNSIE